MKQKLLIFDGSNVMMRAFFAVPPNLITSKGLHTNAIKGTINVVVSLILKHKPTHVAFVMDRKGKTHRHKIYKAYKGNRTVDPEVSARVKPQRIPLYNLLTSMGIKVVHKMGVEADDLVGTLCRMGVEADMEVLIASNDKDFAQLLDNKRVKLLRYIYTTKEYIEITKANCHEHYLVEPKRIVEMMMLQGDKIDNIPKVPGFGPVAIRKLLSSCRRLETADTSNLPAKQKAALEAARDRFPLIRELVTINRDVMPYRLERCKLDKMQRKVAEGICRELEAPQIAQTVKRYAQYLNYLQNH